MSTINSFDTDEHAVIACVSHPDVNTYAFHGMPLLIRAIPRMPSALFELMVYDRRVDVNVRCKRGLTALHICALTKNVAKLSILLGRDDIDINARTNDGDTALSLSAFLGETEALRLLMRHRHTHINTRNNLGASALLLATVKHRVECVRELLLYSESLGDLIAVTRHIPQLAPEARRVAGRLARWHGEELLDENEEQTRELGAAYNAIRPHVSRKSVVSVLVILSNKGFGHAVFCA